MGYSVSTGRVTFVMRGQLVISRHHDITIPAVRRNGHQFATFVDYFGGNDKINLVISGQFAHRFGITLVHT